MRRSCPNRIVEISVKLPNWPKPSRISYSVSSKEPTTGLYYKDFACLCHRPAQQRPPVGIMKEAIDALHITTQLFSSVFACCLAWAGLAWPRLDWAGLAWWPRLYSIRPLHHHHDHHDLIGSSITIVPASLVPANLYLFVTMHNLTGFFFLDFVNVIFHCTPMKCPWQFSLQLFWWRGF